MIDRGLRMKSFNFAGMQDELGFDLGYAEGTELCFADRSLWLGAVENIDIGAVFCIGRARAVMDAFEQDGSLFMQGIAADAIGIYRWHIARQVIDRVGRKSRKTFVVVEHAHIFERFLIILVLVGHIR